MSLVIDERGEHNGSHKPQDAGSMSSRKDLLQSTTKFMNENLSTLTLCNAKSTSLIKEDQKEIKHLNLLSFKIYKCKKSCCNDMKFCPFFHSEADRRRSLIHFKYVSDMCRFVSKGGSCQFKDKCRYSHNHFESLFHHTKYKKRFCNSYPDRVHQCKYQQYCSYAHSEEEIQIILLHNYSYDRDFFIFLYKTQFCPFNLIDHNRRDCVYAHNWQDLRRIPNETRTFPIKCELWKEKLFLQHYSDGCPRGSKCLKCHGWKEQDFHPLNYKRRQCEEKNCIKNHTCPNYHNDGDKRPPQTPGHHRGQTAQHRRPARRPLPAEQLSLEDLRPFPPRGLEAAEERRPRVVRRGPRGIPASARSRARPRDRRRLPAAGPAEAPVCPQQRLLRRGRARGD